MTYAPKTAGEARLSGRRRIVWRAFQISVWLLGLGIWLALLIRPAVGIHAFWDVLIPIAPALLAFLPGLWRNVCPLGCSTLFAHHVGVARHRRLAGAWPGRLALAGVATLLLIVPLRHVLLDRSGPATAVAIAALAAAAVAMGWFFEWKSGWCSGPCPVHPVERLYGSGPGAQLPNAHCGPCEQCVVPCPDSTPGLHVLSVDRSPAGYAAGLIMAGGFAGFIWGWFQVPDYVGADGWSHLAAVYGLPFGGMLVTLALFLVLLHVVGRDRTPTLVRTFAAAAIACYYWYRIPALVGFGPSPGDGMLIDLRDKLPAWFPGAARGATTALFLGWFLARSSGTIAWTSRPRLAPAQTRDYGAPTGSS